MYTSILIVGNNVVSENLYYAIGDVYKVYKVNFVEQEVILQLKKHDIITVIIIEDILENEDRYNIKNILNQYKIPWCHVLTSFNEFIFSSYSQHNMVKICDHCIKMRFINNQKDRVNFVRLKQKDNNKLSCQSWSVTRFAMICMLNLIFNILYNLDNKKRKDNKHFLFILKISNLEITKHSFIQHPLCSRCFKLPKDNNKLAKIKIKSQKLSDDNYRIKSIDKNFYNLLLNDLVDTKVGIFNTVLDDVSAPFSVSVANLPIANGLDEPGIGRAVRYQDSRVIAILEGLERYAGFYPKGKRTVITSSYKDIKNFAINPELFGVHSEEQYSSSSFPFKPFNSTKKIDWVWAFSFIKNKPILIPEFCGYYGYFLEKGYRDAFFYEISNGCSIGGCIEEAILHGIFEVIERDAFLISWYSRLPLQEIDVDEIQDQEFQFMLNRFQKETDYELKFFNMTLDLKIPCIWAVAKSTKVVNSSINLLCAAGCHIDPIRALKGSVHEITGILIAMQEKFFIRRKDALEMFNDSNKVLKMEDHSLVNGLVEAESRFDFLLKNQNKKVKFNSVFPKYHKYYDDLKPLLLNIIDSINNKGMDVICLDQTTLEMKLYGLSCVKILIPGMLSMTFGHNMRRITGLSRLYDVPYELGYYSKRLTEKEINYYPHPFP